MTHALSLPTELLTLGEGWEGSPLVTVVASCMGREEGDGEDFDIYLWLNPTSPYFTVGQVNSYTGQVYAHESTYNIGNAVLIYHEFGGDTGNLEPPF